MNEYACYGKGQTIHSSGQIEWFKNSADDRSVQVGGKQRICTIDGYAMPLTCRGGLMYLSILAKPRNYTEAMQFDSENKNSKWYDAIKLEMESMLEYKVFKKWDKAIPDKHKKVKNPPKCHHRMKFHLVFAVKFDGGHKARLVEDGHQTPEPIENIYSGVVSLRNLRLVIFLGKLNNLER